MMRNDSHEYREDGSAQILSWGMCALVKSGGVSEASRRDLALYRKGPGFF